MWDIHCISQAASSSSIAEHPLHPAVLRSLHEARGSAECLRIYTAIRLLVYAGPTQEEEVCSSAISCDSKCVPSAAAPLFHPALESLTHTPHLSLIITNMVPLVTQRTSIPACHHKLPHRPLICDLFLPEELRSVRPHGSLSHFWPAGTKAAPSKATVFRHHYTPDAPRFRAALSQKDSLPVLRRTGSHASSRHAPPRREDSVCMPPLAHDTATLQHSVKGIH